MPWVGGEFVPTFIPWARILRPRQIDLFEHLPNRSLKRRVLFHPAGVGIDIPDSQQQAQFVNSSGQLILSGCYYGAGTLHKFTTTDEDNSVSVVWTDALGRTVLSRQTNGSTNTFNIQGWLSSRTSIKGSGDSQTDIFSIPGAVEGPVAGPSTAKWAYNAVEGPTIGPSTAPGPCNHRTICLTCLHRSSPGPP